MVVSVVEKIDAGNADKLVVVVVTGVLAVKIVEELIIGVVKLLIVWSIGADVIGVVDTSLCGNVEKLMFSVVNKSGVNVGDKEVS